MTAATTCRSCRAPIIFALTEKGRQIPLDPEPSEKGNMLVTQVGGQLLARQVDPALLPRPHPLHISHFATCPQAAQHRRRRREN